MPATKLASVYNKLGSLLTPGNPFSKNNNKNNNNNNNKGKMNTTNSSLNGQQTKPNMPSFIPSPGSSRQKGILFVESTAVDQSELAKKDKFRVVNGSSSSSSSSHSHPSSSSSSKNGANSKHNNQKLIKSTPITAPNTPKPTKEVHTHDEQLPKPSRVLYSPNLLTSHTFDKFSDQPAPFRNPGVLCYVNSILQSLIHTPLLADACMSATHTKQCNASGFCLFCSFEKLVRACVSGKVKSTISPPIHRCLMAIGKEFKQHRQCDAHEFLRAFIDKLVKESLIGVPKKLDDHSKRTTLVHQIFGGHIRSQVRCLSCGYKSNTYDPIMDLSLDIEGANNLFGALKSFTKAEYLRGNNKYKCPRCQGLREAVKQMSIHEAPRTLVCHLKRFNWRNMKVNKDVDFPSVLDIAPFMSNNIGKQMNGNSEQPIKYSLYGVVVHMGGTWGGHYISYVKTSKGWWCANDSHIQRASVNEVLRPKSYILFYERSSNRKTDVKSSEPAQVSPQSQIQKVSQQPTAISHLKHTEHKPAVIRDTIGSITVKKQDPKETITSKAARPVGVNGDEEDGVEDHGQSIDRKQLKKLMKAKKKEEKKRLLELKGMESTSAESKFSLKRAFSFFDNGKTDEHNQGQADGNQNVSKKKKLSDETPNPPPPTPQTFVASLPSLVTKRLSSSWSIQPKSATTMGSVTSSTSSAAAAAAASPESSASKRTSVKGWTVSDATEDEFRPAVKLSEGVLINWEEASNAKKQKLQQVIERETMQRSQNIGGAFQIPADKVKKGNDIDVKTKAAMVQFGEDVDTWAPEDTSMIKALSSREAMLYERSQEMKRKRPSKYDVEYDKGKVKKVKSANAWDEANKHGSSDRGKKKQKGNPFQKTFEMLYSKRS